MATIRSSFGDEGNERVEQRRLAAPGAAAHEDITAGVQHPLGFVTDVRGQGAFGATSCAAEKDRVPKRRTVMARCGLAGGTQMATRDPSSNRASRIGRGKRAGPRRGAGDTDAADDQERADESVKHRVARRCPSLPSRFEPQPRGAVTRRAVAQRRSRGGGLTRLSAAAIRGFGLGFVVVSFPPFRCGLL